MRATPAARPPAGAGPAIYLDWAAMAPPRAEALAAHAQALARLAAGEWANSASVHGPGRAARRALDTARARLGELLGVSPARLRFTAGGTAALALALAGDTPVLASAVEHSAVAHAAPAARLLAVDGLGRVAPSKLQAALMAMPGGTRVAIQHASHETGVVQDLDALAEVCRGAGARLVVDAVQSAGKLALCDGAAAVAVAAHKLGGVPGTGLLVVDRPDAWPDPPGTLNLPGVLAMVVALEALAADPSWLARAGGLAERLARGVAAAGGRIVAEGAERLPTLATVHRPGVPAEQQLIALDLAGVAVSIGPACSSGTMRASPTLLALGEHAAARQSVRVSWGWTSTEADIDRFLQLWSGVGAGRRAA